MLLPCRERYALLAYAVTGDAKACEGGRTPGGGAFAMLRLLLRRPRDGPVEPSCTVPAELTEPIDSFELLRTC